MIMVKIEKKYFKFFGFRLILFQHWVVEVEIAQKVCGTCLVKKPKRVLQIVDKHAFTYKPKLPIFRSDFVKNKEKNIAFGHSALFI